MSSYVLDNAAEQTGQRFASLEACYDRGTVRQLQEIAVAGGWSCLEVGAGNGSIARRLADLVAPDGHVLATDIDPRWIDAAHSNIELRRHDIVADELECDAFDLAHARLGLSHLPDRDRALRRMIESLKPGGWLLIKDFDAHWLAPMTMGEPADVALADKVVRAFRLVLERSGVTSRTDAAAACHRWCAAVDVERDSCLRTREWPLRRRRSLAVSKRHRTSRPDRSALAEVTVQSR